MDNLSAKDYNAFLELFSPAELPATLSTDDIVEYSRLSTDVPHGLLYKVLSEWEEIDEYTEFIPLYKMEIDDNIIALVYWKGSLLNYEFILVTMDNKGNSLNRKVIAGTISNGESIMSSVAHISDDFIITTVVGESKDGYNYEATQTKSYNMEILPSGEIISQREDELLWQEGKKS